MSFKGQSYTKIYPKLTQKQLEFIVGTVLGDAHISWRKHAQYKNALLRIEQSDQEYVIWKKKQLGKIAHTIKPYTRINHFTNTEFTTYYFNSSTNPALSRLHNIFYQNKRKVFNSKLFPYLTPYALAIWFMDDGGIKYHTKGKGYYLNIATCSFTLKEHLLIQHFFKKYYQLECKVRHIRKNPFIQFCCPDSYKLTKIIKPYIIPSMRYKIGLSKS